MMSSRLALALVFCLVALPYGIYVATSDTANLVRFFPDDAFYYLEPASNFVSYGQPSFDGIHSTNGFQPLHFVVMLAAAWPKEKSSQLVLAFLLTAAMTLAALAWLARCASKHSPNSVVALFLLLSLPPGIVLFITNAGMETCTVLCATIGLWYASGAALDRGLGHRGYNLLLGVLLAAFLLSRLDNLLAGSFLILYLAVSAIRLVPKVGAKSTVYRVAPIFLVPLILCGGYLLLNVLTTGHVLPISAYVKHHESIPFDISWQAVTRGSKVGMAVAMVPLLLSLLTLGDGLVRQRTHKSRLGAALSPLLSLNAGNVVFYLYLVGFAANFHRWYFAFPVAITLINIACWVCAVAGRLRRRQSGDSPDFKPTRRRNLALTSILIVANLSTCFAFLYWFGGRQQSTSFQLWKVAQQVNRSLPASAIIGTYDAGVIGFFGKPTVINLDGLCNDFDYYLKYKQPRRLLEYARQKGITHLLVRDSLMSIEQAPDNSGEASVTFVPDSRIRLSSDRECFRYAIPGKFSLRCYAIDQ